MLEARRIIVSSIDGGNLRITMLIEANDRVGGTTEAATTYIGNKGMFGVMLCVAGGFS